MLAGATAVRSASVSILDDAREGMDTDIRPQDDLFGHVNGRWLAETEIPSDRSSWGPFVQLADICEQQVRDIITELADGVADGTADASTDAADLENARKIADLYNSFMDTERIASLGLDPVRALLEAASGLRDVRDLAAFLGEFERVGGYGVFGSYVDTDDRNSDRYLLHVVQGGLGLPDESYYRDDKFAEIREAYVAYLGKLLTLGEHADPEGAAQRILALDTELAKGHWERADTRDVQKTYNLRTGDELRAMCPAFDWDAYVTNLGGHLDGEHARSRRCACGSRRTSSTSRPSSPRRRSRPGGSGCTAGCCGPRRRTSPTTSSRPTSTSTAAPSPARPSCGPAGSAAVSFVEGAVGEAVGEEYVARHFPPESKAKMDDLVANLLAAYRVSIAALDWMTEETKERAYDKLATFRPKIGYPDKFRDYSGLPVVARRPGRQRPGVGSAFETDRQLTKIGSPVDRDEWFMLPQTVNAYYNPGTNEICFPAGILQKPFFSPDAHPAENYGGIGAVIGHEIGHGFDDQGAQYDGAGNLNDWWTPDDKAAFEVKSKTLIEQYDGLSPRAIPDENVNGALTVGENIGDLGGLTIGHKAFVISAAAAPRLGRGPPDALHELGVLLADEAPDRAGAPVPHHRPAQPAGVPRQHRAQPRRVPRGVRDDAGRRAVARAGRPGPDLVTLTPG